MKTILTIGGDSYVVKGEPAKILDVLQGAVRVDEMTIYGPEGESSKEYAEEWGYARHQVVASKPSKISLKLVADEDVMSTKEFEGRKAETQKRNEERLKQEAKANLPKAA